MPFTVEQFLEVFESYNQAVFPFQFLLTIFALAVVILTLARVRNAGRWISVFLAVLWLWMGIVYHLVFFTRINGAAYIFGAMCLIQALIFMATGVIRGKLDFEPRSDLTGIAGACLIVFALIAYPAIGYLLGHVYPRAPTFGTPCPSTIYTLGLLLWTKGPLPLYVLAIPFIWSLIGASAALTLGIREDSGLFAAGIVAVFLTVWKNRVSRVETA